MNCIAARYHGFHAKLFGKPRLLRIGNAHQTSEVLGGVLGHVEALENLTIVARLFVELFLRLDQVASETRPLSSQVFR